MALFEDNTHVFILRIWLERRAHKGAPAEWRGVIEHLPTGRRLYLCRLEELHAFLRTYLAGFGVMLGDPDV